MTLRDLLIDILKISETSFSKTKLLKIAYLIDLFFYRRYQKKMIEEDWVYFKYGPYNFDYDNILATTPFIIEENTIDTGKIASIVSIAKNVNFPEVEADNEIIITKVIDEFAGKSLNEILDFIYFNTEPMMNAENRGETLSFANILPEEYYKVKKLRIDDKVKAKLRKQFKEKLKNVKRS